MATRRGPALAGGAVARRRRRLQRRRGRDDAVLHEHQLHRLLRPHRNPDAAGRTDEGTSYRGRFDYTDDRYGAAAEHMLIDADVPARGRLRPAPERAAHLRPAALQPAAATQRGRPQADLAGEPRLRDRRARRPRCRPARPPACSASTSSRATRRRRRVLARVRAAAGAVPDLAWRRRPGRRLHRGHQPAELHARPAAAASRAGCLPRPARSTTARDRSRLQRPVGRGAALLDRAGPSP